MTGPLKHVAVGNLLGRKVRRDADDDVAHIVQPLLEIFVVGAGKECRVFVEQAGKPGLSGEPIVARSNLEPCGERSVAQDRLVDAEDGGFVVPDLLLHLVLQRAQLRGRLVAGGFKAGQLGGDFVVFQALGVGIHEDLVDAVGGPDRDARRNGNSLAHRRAAMYHWWRVLTNGRIDRDVTRYCREMSLENCRLLSDVSRRKREENGARGGPRWSGRGC